MFSFNKSPEKAEDCVEKERSRSPTALSKGEDSQADK